MAKIHHSLYISKYEKELHIGDTKHALVVSEKARIFTKGLRLFLQKYWG